MRPGARLAAAIEILESIAAGDSAAETAVTAYCRARRFIGSKDRRFIADLVFDLLRHRARLEARIKGTDGDPSSARALLLTHLIVGQTHAPADLPALFAEQPYGPGALRGEEEALLAALARQPDEESDLEDWVRYECPEWLLPRLQAAFGSAWRDELAALLRPAPLDLRVNGLKATRDEVRARLAEAGIETEDCALAPLGLRVVGRTRAVEATAAYRAGLVEVQDESSQLAALLCDARPGMTVLDFCAGAGGKALALAAAMGNQGRLVMYDSDPKRLRRSHARLERAGVAIDSLVTARADLAAAGPFDRVLIDAPCSGSGRWRRSVDARWRLTQAALQGLQRSQARLLDEAADLVRPGGRLIYATCSFLPAENGEQLDAFLARRPDFAAVSLVPLWAETIGGDAPFDPAARSFLLTPARHGTDGFYLAVLQREATV